MILSKGFKLKWRIVLLLTLVLLAVVFRFSMFYIYESSDYQRFLVFSRMDGLAFGAIVYFLLERKQIHSLEIRVSFFLFVLSILSLVFLGLIEVLTDLEGVSNKKYPGLHDNYLEIYSFSHLKYSLLSICFASFLFWLLSSKKGLKLQFLLELAPLKFFGKISYGVYLYHFPLLISLKLIFRDISDLTLLFILIVLTFFISSVSWFVVEKPVIRRFKRSMSK